MHQYVIAQIKVGNQNSPNIVIDKKNLSNTSKWPILMFCKKSRKSICGFIKLELDKKLIIITVIVTQNLIKKKAAKRRPLLNRTTTYRNSKEFNSVFKISFSGIQHPQVLS